MYLRIQHWFNETFPDAQHTLNRDSAIPGISASYFSVMCSDLRELEALTDPSL